MNCWHWYGSTWSVTLHSHNSFFSTEKAITLYQSWWCRSWTNDTSYIHFRPFHQKTSNIHTTVLLLCLCYRISFSQKSSYGSATIESHTSDILMGKCDGGRGNTLGGLAWHERKGIWCMLGLPTSIRSKRKNWFSTFSFFFLPLSPSYIPWPSYLVSTSPHGPCGTWENDIGGRLSNNVISTTHTL